MKFNIFKKRDKVKKEKLKEERYKEKKKIKFNIFKKRDKVKKVKEGEDKEKEERIKKADLIEEEPSVIQEPSKPEGLTGRIKEIDEKLDMLTQSHKIKKKPFKLPFSVRNQLKTIAKKNKVLVILLRRNRTAEAKIVKIDQGFIIVNGKVHNLGPDYIFLWEGKTPCIVLPEWDLNPIGTEDYYKAVEDNRVADPQTIIIRAMRNVDKLQLGQGLPAKTWIWIAIGAIVIGFVLFGKG